MQVYYFQYYKVYLTRYQIDEERQCDSPSLSVHRQTHTVTPLVL